MKSLKPHFSGKSHVIWDWNGTLLDDVELCLDIIQGMLKQHGLRPIALDDYLEIFRFPVVEYYKDVGFDLAKTPFEVIATDFMNSYLSRVREATLFQGVPELLVELKGEGVACSVLSAAPERDLKELLAHHGIETFFEHVYGLTDHYAHSKIDRGRELVGRLGVDAGELILVGDTDHDLEVGEALGIDVLLVPGGHQSHARLAKRHHRVGRRSPHLSF